MKKLKIKYKIVDKTCPIKQPLRYALEGDAGIDLVATSWTWDEYGNVVYDTNLAIESPEGYVGLIFPRSSLSKKQLALANHVGILDSNYRGNITFKFKPTLVFVDGSAGGEAPTEALERDEMPLSELGMYDIGDRIGQLIIMPYPLIEFEEYDELSETVRGSGGYGSTDNLILTEI